MRTVGDIFKAIDAIAPFSTAMDFDNSGLLVGSREQGLDCALLALDITPAVIDEVVKRGAQLIISHHPVIFHPLRNVEMNSPVYRLIQNGLAAICAHTNLDIADVHGVNTVLAETLGFEKFSTIPEDREKLLRICDLNESADGTDFLNSVKERLGCGCIKVTEIPATVRKVALCGGAGGDYATLAKWAGADLYITGEAKHNEVLDAAAVGMPMALCGHHATEFPVLAGLQKYLQQAVPGVEYILTNHTEEPYVTL